MKRLKISTFAVIAIIMGICGSAFTALPNSPTVDQWFLYDGSGSLSNPSSYTYSGSISTCNAHIQFCAFNGIRQASPNQNMPTQTSLNSASSQSSGFTVEKAGLVVFKP